MHVKPLGGRGSALNPAGAAYGAQDPQLTPSQKPIPSIAYSALS